MEHAPERGPARGCRRPDLGLRLAEWDELGAPQRRELEQHAGACPECGRELALLQRAQAWLESGAAARPLGTCPSADELYDFGRGPGARRRSEAERLSLRAHVAACPDCTRLVRTLEQRPPAPLLFDPQADRLRSQVERRRRLQMLVPLAAAAAVIAVLVWRAGTAHDAPSATDEFAAAQVRFPSETALRGSAPGDLWFPRDRVLSSAQGLWAPLVFEVAPHERATRFRVNLYRHAGGAFDAGGEVAQLASDTPLIAAPEGAPLELAAGHYTWEAWATVDGLELALGRRDFEVLDDEALAASLAQRAAASEPARSEARLHLLHDAGFLGDARALARSLPPSPERDAYLARRPGR